MFYFLVWLFIIILVMKQEGLTYEIVIVDDNSNDGTTDIAEELREKDNIPVR